MVINTVGHLAEAAWHTRHRRLPTPGWRCVCKTMPAKASPTRTSSWPRDKDFELAKKIEEVIQWQPAKEGGALEGTPRPPQRGHPAGRCQHQQGRQDGLRRARTGQPRRGDRRRNAQGEGLSAGRPTGLAHGVYARSKIFFDDQRAEQRHIVYRRGQPEGDQIAPGGRAALGRDNYETLNRTTRA